MSVRFLRAVAALLRCAALVPEMHVTIAFGQSAQFVVQSVSVQRGGGSTLDEYTSPALLTFTVHNGTAQTQTLYATYDCGPFQYYGYFDEGGYWWPPECAPAGSATSRLIGSVGAGQNTTIAVELRLPVDDGLTGSVPMKVWAGSSPTASDQATARVSWNSYTGALSATLSETVFTPVLSPKGTLAGVTANGPRSTRMTLLNNGTGPATYSLSVSCSGAMTSCSLATTSVSLSPASSAAIDLMYQAGEVGTSGAARVIAVAPPTRSGRVQADTANLTVPLVDNIAPRITVSPMGDVDTNGDTLRYTLSSHQTTITVDVCDEDGAVADPVVTYGAGTVTRSSLVATMVTGCHTAKRATYALLANGGSGGLHVSVGDGAHTSDAWLSYFYDDTQDNAPTISALHPAVTVSASSTVIDTFVVTNPGWKSNTYALAGSCSATAGTCAVTLGASSVTIAAGASSRVTAQFNSGAGGVRTTATVSATYAGPAGSASRSASMVATADGSSPSIAVTPTNGTVVTSSPIRQVRIEWCDPDDKIVQRTVTWQGQLLPDAFVASTKSGCYWQSSGYSLYTNLAIDPWQQDLVVTARDTAGHVATSTTTITYSVPLSSYRPGVAIGSSWHRLAQGTVAGADTFTVTNTGTRTAAYALTSLCGQATTLSNCTVNPASLSLATGASAAAIVSYTRSGALDVADTLRLTAKYTSPLGGAIADTGRKVVTAASVEAAPAVAGVGGPLNVPAGWVATSGFTITNTSSVQITYSLGFRATNGFTIADYPDRDFTTDPLYVAVNAGQTASYSINVRAPTTVGVSGNAIMTASYVSASGQTLSATATGRTLTSGSSSSGSTIAFDITGASPPQPSPGSNANVTFTVRNTGTSSGTVSFVSSCTGPAIVSCGAAVPTSATLSAGQSSSVTVAVGVASTSGQSGTVLLTATSGAVTSSASVGLSTGIAKGPLTISTTLERNPGTSIARDQCLTIAAGDLGAYECSDLRLLHPLPTTTTMNKPRTPTLIYMSGHARPVALVATDLTIDGTICPTQVTATVRFSSADTAQKSFAWNGPCGQRATRRIVVPVDAVAKNHATGLYRYTLEIRTTANGTNYTIADTSGVMAVVNRAASKFGAGWWLDGVEQLMTVPNRTDQLLWIGGDGSTRLYTQVSTSNTFVVQPTVDRPDTLEKLSGGAGYRRHLRNGAFVEFDGFLRHAATVNAAGHRTQFFWSSSQLDSIALPTADPNNTQPRRTYKFSYSNGLLVFVIAPQGPNEPRVTSLSRVTQSGVTDLAIRSPGDSVVHFYSDAAGRITVRKNRLGDGTRYGYDATTGVLTRAAIDLTRTSGSTDSIRTSFCPAEASSLIACATGLADPAKVRTLLDGPRTDVADTTAFYVSGFGAPERIVDALGNHVSIERTDLRWPLLATATIQPNGHRVEASYTERGLVSETRDINPFGRDTNEVARTRYQWNAKYDKVDVVTAPTGEVSRIGYFPNGDRQWQEDGRGTVSRTWFAYNPNRQLASVQVPGNSVDELQRMDYDVTSGNLVREVTPTNDTTFYHFDTIGRVDSIASPANDTQQRSEKFVFDVTDRVLVHRSIGPAVVNPRGTARAVTLVDTTTYDTEGRPTSVVRRSEPNLANTGYPETDWTYDAAGRKLTEVRVGGSHQAWTYDPAGNVSTWSTGRYSSGVPVVVTTRYDALNRPLQRTMPQVTVAAARGQTRFACQHGPRFPYFAYLTSGSTYDPTGEGACDGTSPLPQPLVIPADVADFTYDALGSIKTANNNDARITREYYPNGALKTETQAIAIFDDLTPLAARFNAHRYRLDYRYDLSGRRLARTDSIPTCDGCVQTYHYDPVSGFLDDISDRGAGHNPAQFGFEYDGAGRVTGRTVNGTTSRTDHYYDANGQLIDRSVSGAGSIIYQDHITYDRSGRITSTSIGSNLPEIAGSTASAYNGLGALAYFSQFRNGSVLDDEFSTDGLGNRISDKRWVDGPYTSHDYRYNRELLEGVNQLTPWRVGDPPPPSALQRGDTTMTDYGATGAVEYEFHAGFVFDNNAYSWQPDTLGDQWTWHAYGADERLRVSQHSVQVPQFRTRTVFSDYRYDALGRRVAARTRWDPHCQLAEPDCLSTIERTIWDGDQVLMELRAPAATEVEYGWTAFQGTVKYTHGAGIDEPLAIWKSDVGGVIPHRSWRGTYEAGTPIDQSTSNVTWPARTQDVFHASDVRVTAIQPSNWMGSIVDSKAEPSGLQYMRNRYYDPRTGRFTQEDPIGLAGGMNLYGFGGGDPVNESDPFGLCPCFLIPVAIAAEDIAATAIAGTLAWLAARYASEQASRVPIYIQPEHGEAAAGHAGEAQAEGKPATGVIDRAGADARRKQRLRGIPTVPGMDRDEYPPAVIKPDATGTSIKHIPSPDNRRSGRSIGHQIKGLPDGTLIEIKVGPKPNQ